MDRLCASVVCSTQNLSRRREAQNHAFLALATSILHNILSRNTKSNLQSDVLPSSIFGRRPSFGTSRRLPKRKKKNEKGLHGDLTAMAYLTECSDKPLLAIVGGGSLEPRLKLIDGLLDLVDTLAVGGGLSATFLAAAAETGMESAGSLAATGSSRFGSCVSLGQRGRRDHLSESKRPFSIHLSCRPKV